MGGMSIKGGLTDGDGKLLYTDTAEAIFAERRDIGVVVDEYRHPVILSHLFAHMYILHGDIVPVSYYAALGVYRARPYKAD